LKIPESHSSKTLAGKEVAFEIEMKNVQNAEFPELDDQFAKNLGKFETIDQIRKNIEQGLSEEKKLSEKQRLRNEILENIAQQSSLEIPEELINQEKARMLENLKNQVAQRFQMSFEEYLKEIRKTEKELLDSFQEEAEKRLRGILVLMAIGEKEGVKAEEEEIKQKTDQILKNYPNPEEAKKNIDPERLKEYTKEEIKNEKTLAELESFAKDQ
jgi:trigger factor